MICVADSIECLHDSRELGTLKDAETPHLKMTWKPTILLVSDGIPDVLELKNYLENTSSIHQVESLGDFRNELSRVAPDLVLCRWSFHGGEWPDVIDTTREFDDILPVIVISARDDQKWIKTEPSAWRDVFDRGGFDVIEAPFKYPDVVSVIHQAIESQLSLRIRQGTI